MSYASRPIVVIILMIAVNAAFTQQGWDKYLPRTLNEIIRQHEKTVLESNGPLFSADVFPSKVNVIYMGEVRKVSPERKKFISQYFQSRGLEKEIPNLFESELLFMEGSVEYWLPVQTKVLPYFSEELKKRDKVDLFVNWLGASNENGNVDWIFIVNEFKSDSHHATTGASRASAPALALR